MNNRTGGVQKVHARFRLNAIMLVVIIAILLLGLIWPGISRAEDGSFCYERLTSPLLVETGKDLSSKEIAIIDQIGIQYITQNDYADSTPQWLGQKGVIYMSNEYGQERPVLKMFDGKRSIVVADHGELGTFWPQASDDGNTVIYFVDVDGIPSLWWLNPFSGEGGELPLGPNEFAHALSPDGKTIAFISGEDNNIYTISSQGIGRKNLTNFPPGALTTNSPIWSEDGKSLIFSQYIYQNSVNDQGFVIDLNGKVTPIPAPGRHNAPVNLVDNKVVMTSIINQQFDLYLADIDDNSLVNLTHSSANEEAPRLSPDGKLVSYISSQYANSPHYIYIVNADGTDPCLLIEGYDSYWQPES